MLLVRAGPRCTFLSSSFRGQVAAGEGFPAGRCFSAPAACASPAGSAAPGCGTVCTAFGGSGFASATGFAASCAVSRAVSFFGSSFSPGRGADFFSSWRAGTGWLSRREVIFALDRGSLLALQSRRIFSRSASLSFVKPLILEPRFDTSTTLVSEKPLESSSSKSSSVVSPGANPSGRRAQSSNCPPGMPRPLRASSVRRPDSQMMRVRHLSCFSCSITALAICKFLKTSCKAASPSPAGGLSNSC